MNNFFCGLEGIVGMTFLSNELQTNYLFLANLISVK